jgi:hypothetical protein
LDNEMTALEELRRNEMSITVLIEPIPSGFRASTGSPLDLSAEASSRDEVITKLQSKLDQRMLSGAELLQIEPDFATRNPWAKHAGMFENDPEFSAWQEAIAENRRLADEDPSIL